MNDTTAGWPKMRTREERMCGLEARLRTTAEALRGRVSRCEWCNGTGTIPGVINAFGARCSFCRDDRAILAALDREGLT